MADRSWKKFERRMARDVGTERIPVTGERFGADALTPLFAFQFKLRKTIPGWLFEWLQGIVLTARVGRRVGVLVLKAPRMRDDEAVVVLRWRDWVALHGSVQRAITGGVNDRREQTRVAASYRRVQEVGSRRRAETSTGVCIRGEAAALREPVDVRVVQVSKRG